MNSWKMESLAVSLKLFLLPHSSSLNIPTAAEIAGASLGTVEGF